MKAACGFAMLAAGCSDPYGTCRPGTYRDPGPGCTVPQLATTIDGDGAEWGRPDLSPIAFCYTDQAITGLPPCAAGYLEAVQLAIDQDALVVHLVTHGKPFVNATYQLGVYRYYDPDTTPGHLDVLGFSISSSGVGVDLNGYDLVGYAIDDGWGSDGLELRIPFDTLPFAGNAQVSGGVFHQPQSSLVTQVCWDPADPIACATP